MKNRFFAVCLFFALFVVGLPSQALELNLIKVESDEGRHLSRVFSDAYGYPASQVDPLFGGPVEEIPTLLRIAQVAKANPHDVLALRRSGMSYPKILDFYRVNPGIFSPVDPIASAASDDLVLQLGRYYLYRQIFGIDPVWFPYLPGRGTSFAESILYPYHPSRGYFMPPGIAKKYGLWVPPGQRKKINWGNQFPKQAKFYSEGPDHFPQEKSPRSKTEVKTFDQHPQKHEGPARQEKGPKKERGPKQNHGHGNGKSKGGGKGKH